MTQGQMALGVGVRDAATFDNYHFTSTSLAEALKGQLADGGDIQNFTMSAGVLNRGSTSIPAVWLGPSSKQFSQELTQGAYSYGVQRSWALLGEGPKASTLARMPCTVHSASYGLLKEKNLV